MKRSDLLKAFAALGEWAAHMPPLEMETIANRAHQANGWFTPENVQKAFEGLARYLDREKLENWVAKYPLEDNIQPRKVGVIMAGNIPMAGIHDFIAVLMSGHHLMAKLSARDTVLMKHVATKLKQIEPRFADLISFYEGIMKGMDAVIATGSDNSSRYFDYYFAKYPNIIRKNRVGCAVIRGDETKESLAPLAEDIYRYFGLGCRNVSKLFVPEGYDFQPLLQAWQQFEGLSRHHKYNNNYDYNKSIYLVNKEPHYDTGFAMLRKSEQLVSPVSVVYYEKYDDAPSLKARLAEFSDKIQCVVSRNAWLDGSLPFGKAQEPELWDYADNVNTLEFLRQLS